MGGSPPGEPGAKGGEPGAKGTMGGSPQTGDQGAKGDKGAGAMREHELHRGNPPATDDTGGKSR